MELIKKSLNVLSRNSVKNCNGCEYIFYSIQYANKFGEYLETEEFNIATRKDKINFGYISLKQIKEIIPKHKFCCCYSKTCTCEFVVRYKSHDSNGIYPWIWCDMITDHDTATPFNSEIILKILVFVNSSLFNYDGYCQKSEHLEYNHIVIDGYISSKTESRKITDEARLEIQKDSFQVANNNKSEHSIKDSNFISLDFCNPEKLMKNGELSNSFEKLNSKVLELNANVGSNNFAYEDLVDEIGRWSRKPDGSYKDIRVLLSSLQQVLWDNAQWEPVEFSKLMSDIELVKKVYRKAIILCHPDKHHKESEEHKSRVHLIFMAINESNNKCSKL